MTYLSEQLGSEYGFVGAKRDNDASDEYNAIFYKKDVYNLLGSGTKWLSKLPNKGHQEVMQSRSVAAEATHLWEWKAWKECLTTQCPR